MSAAILQGVPATTLDTDIWIDLPETQYVKVLSICSSLGGETLAATVVSLRDDTLVNFLYRIDGLGAFKTETKNAVRLNWFGMKVDVMPLESIIRSKETVGREKDLAHLPLLKKRSNFATGRKKRSNTSLQKGWLIPASAGWTRPRGGGGIRAPIRLFLVIFCPISGDSPEYSFNIRENSRVPGADNFTDTFTDSVAGVGFKPTSQKSAILVAD